MQEILGAFGPWTLSGGGYDNTPVSWLPWGKAKVGADLLDVAWRESSFEIWAAQARLGAFKWDRTVKAFKGRCTLGGYWQLTSKRGSEVSKYVSGEVPVPRITPSVNVFPTSGEVILLTLDPDNGPFQTTILQALAGHTCKVCAPWDLPFSVIESASKYLDAEIAYPNGPTIFMIQVLVTIDAIFEAGAASVWYVPHSYQGPLDIRTRSELMYLPRPSVGLAGCRISKQAWGTIGKACVAEALKLPRNGSGWQYPECTQAVKSWGNLPFSPPMSPGGLISAACLCYNVPMSSPLSTT